MLDVYQWHLIDKTDKYIIKFINYMNLGTYITKNNLFYAIIVKFCLLL
jgi:hypothetical protein